MSSLPNENLEDVLLPLDRWTLDAVQITNLRFRQLVEERMSDVCLREIEYAYFCSSDGRSLVSPVGRQQRLEHLSDHEDFEGFFSAFLKALRSFHVDSLHLEGIDFTPELATLVLKAPIVAHRLSVYAGSCAQLTPAQFHALVFQFSPTELRLGLNPDSPLLLRASQISDDFLQVLVKNRVRYASLLGSNPVGGGSFSVADDAIINFVVQPDDPAAQGDDDALYTHLLVSNGSFTKDLFKRLIEASAASMRTQSLRVFLRPVHFENEDLRDFAQRLSYRYRGTEIETRIYDFPGKQHGKVAAMDLQIALQCDTLTMIRARRPNAYFQSSDE